MNDIPIQGEHHPLCFPSIRDVRIGDWGPSCFTCQVLGIAYEQGRRDALPDGLCFPSDVDSAGAAARKQGRRKDYDRLKAKFEGTP